MGTSFNLNQGTSATAINKKTLSTNNSSSSNIGTSMGTNWGLSGKTSASQYAGAYVEEPEYLTAEVGGQEVDLPLPDGLRYKGEISSDFENGDGTLYYDGYKFYQGTWKVDPSLMALAESKTGIEG